MLLHSSSANPAIVDAKLYAVWHVPGQPGMTLGFSLQS